MKCKLRSLLDFLDYRELITFLMPKAFIYNTAAVMQMQKKNQTTALLSKKAINEKSNKKEGKKDEI